MIGTDNIQSQDIVISFELPCLPFLAVSQKNGQKTLELKTRDGLIEVSVYYDYDVRPLVLSAKICMGDKVEIVLLDYKTDNVKEPRELVLRYKAQIDLYAKALEKSFGKKVKEKILYSFSLEKAVNL